MMTVKRNEEIREIRKGEEEERREERRREEEQVDQKMGGKKE